VRYDIYIYIYMTLGGKETHFAHWSALTAIHQYPIYSLIYSSLNRSIAHIIPSARTTTNVNRTGSRKALLCTFHFSNTCSLPDDDPIAGSKLVALSNK
jgi:hypothetical protein